jgi:hypothetical protein
MSRYRMPQPAIARRPSLALMCNQDVSGQVERCRRGEHHGQDDIPSKHRQVASDLLG